MKFFKSSVVIFIVSSLLALTGCDLFRQNDTTRPAPVRPNPSPSPQIDQAPTKNTPGINSLSEEDLMQTLSDLEKAAKGGNWDRANRNADTLGIDMARYRPDRPDGKSLRDMTEFNVIYTKLQADVKTRNKEATLKDIQNLKRSLNDLNKTPR